MKRQEINKEAELEKCYKNLFDTVTEAIYIQDKDGKFIDVNNGVLKMYGYDKSELIGNTPEFLSAPDKNDLSNVALCLKEALKGKTQKFDFWGKRKNGEIFLKEVILNKGYYLGKDVIIATARDNSNKKKAEIEIARMQSRLALIFKNLPNVVLYETNGPNDFMSDNVTDMLGYPPYLFIENVKFINSIVHPDYSKILERKIYEWLDNSDCKNLKIEYPCKKADGTYIWIDDFLQKGKTPDGKNYIIGMMMDVTEKKKYLEKLEHYAEEMKNMNLSKDKFFSIIAHDLRGPFNGLLGFSTVLLEELHELTSAEIKEYIGYIHTSAKTVYNLVDNLLQWSRIQTGRIEYQPIKIDLYEEVFKILEAFNTNAINKKIKINNCIANDTFVFADQNMLRCILQNLISNAIKFSRIGGTVKISAFKNEQNMQIEISDNGVGIDNKDIPKLFKIDSQFTKPGTANEEGTGLGLILSKELVEKNKGQIWVKSTVKKGSTFTFTLPSPNQNE